MATTCCCSSSSSQEDYEIIMNQIVAVEDPIRHIDDLISYITPFLNKDSEIARTADVDSSINSAGVLVDKVLKRSRWNLCKREFKLKLNRETRKLIIDVTNRAAHIRLLGVGLSVVAFTLERVEQVASNTEECLKLLKYMCDLGSHIRQLDERLAQEKLNRVLQFIVEGSALCISLIESHSFCSRCLGAPVMAEDLEMLRSDLGLQYADLSLEAIRAVLDRIPEVLPPTQGLAPEAAGTEEPSKRVTKLLHMESESVIAVVIYGQGGIGKTTLATIVFNKLDLTNYKFCRVDMQQDCKEADLQKLQQQILRDLFIRNIELRSSNEGRDKLSEEIKKGSAPLFIFVDNVLRESDFEKLLPVKDLRCLPPQSRILLTTRNLNETRLLLVAEIERHHYLVPFLPQEKAEKLLCKLALGNEFEKFEGSIDTRGLLKICRGVPLVLTLAGARLREHRESVGRCSEEVEYLKSSLLAGEDSELSERMVDFVFNRLGDSCKETFLDIVFFYCNFKRRVVACAVGETELQELERAALVNISDRRRVSVHDIVQARAKRLSPDGVRIVGEQSLADVLQSKERIKKIKGISDVDKLEALHVNLMSRCLRVLIMTYKPIVNGECKGPFENLRFLSVRTDCYALMDVSKHPRLAVLRVTGFGQLLLGVAFPSALKYIKLAYATLPNLSTTTFSLLQSLHVLKLSKCVEFDSLPESIGNLTALEKLDLSECDDLESLPQSFGNLCSLRYLRLQECNHLCALPESFGNLASLELLRLENCLSLLNLPQNFGQLKRLKYLCISECIALQRLSDDFEGLSSLIAIKASGCDKLEGETIEKVAKMKGVMTVTINRSPLLEERWKQVRDQYSLAVRGMYGEYMRRALLQRGSRFVHADENREYHESSPEDIWRDGEVKELCVLLTVCDLTLAENSRYLEQVKKKWEEVGGEKMKVFVDLGVSLEESERRVREILLPLLPRGSRAWIAGDSRARLFFAYSVFMAYKKDTEYDHPTVIACIKTMVDTEENMIMGVEKFIIMPEDCTPAFHGAHFFNQLFSPISEAPGFIR